MKIYTQSEICERTCNMDAKFKLSEKKTQLFYFYTDNAVFLINHVDQNDTHLIKKRSIFDGKQKSCVFFQR